MLRAPHAARRSQAGLDFVENQQHLILVADLAQLPQKFTAVMIVAAFPLDRLDDDRRDIDAALVDEVANLLLALFLSRDHVRFALRLRKRKIDGRV